MTTTFTSTADCNLTSEKRVSSAADHRIDWSGWLASETIAAATGAAADFEGLGKLSDEEAAR